MLQVLQELILYYTGVGSRDTPPDILILMEAIARKMASFGFWLRSGGAIGADSAFERGAGMNKQIFYANDATAQAMAIAAKFHPKWNRCSPFARKLHGRNAFQILGPNLNDPTQYCICWTPDGCISHATRQYATGGTGTAISIADYYKVLIVNLAIPEHFKVWDEWAKMVEEVVNDKR